MPPPPLLCNAEPALCHADRRYRLQLHMLSYVTAIQALAATRMDNTTGPGPDEATLGRDMWPLPAKVGLSNPEQLSVLAHTCIVMSQLEV